MKVAIKKVVGVELYCPECDAIIVSPGGPHAWDVNELVPVVTCPECSKSFKTPKV
jgi:hypothetical protein